MKTVCRIFTVCCFTIMGIFLFSKTTYSHVKWFSDFTFFDRPASLTEIFTPVFLLMMLISVAAMIVLVYLDQKLSRSVQFKNTIDWLDSYKKNSLFIMKAATAAVLLLSFQTNSLFVPELSAPHDAVGWIEFFLAVMLLFPRLVFIVGVGVIGLCIYGIIQYGWFHMLDYSLVFGVGYYLAVQAFKSEKVKETGLIALYLTVGFSLCWVAMEKLVFPEWSLIILQKNPRLTLGFDPQFFLVGAAFVEFALGFLMIICLLQRPLALVVTVVFFSTTLIFGKTEVVGHTIIHAALIVFVLQGKGTFYRPPIKWHRTLTMRILFAAVNFILVLFALLFIYQKSAMNKHLTFTEKVKEQAGVIVSAENAPQIELLVEEDMTGGWNVQVVTENFEFSPENVGHMHQPNQGHGHIYLNGKKIGRLYNHWFYIADTEDNVKTLTVQLNTNDHQLYILDNKPIEATVELESNLEDDPAMMAH